VLLQGGHDRAAYDITGREAYTATALAALYGELGGRRVEARSIDDAAFVAGLVGDSAADDHLRYGAELLASFGRAIRSGYLDSCSDAVAKLTGRPACTLREVLAPHLRPGS
jgi:NAD(P)H dehydrogenase (quinone)